MNIKDFFICLQKQHSIAFLPAPVLYHLGCETCVKQGALEEVPTTEEFMQMPRMKYFS